MRLDTIEKLTIENLSHGRMIYRGEVSRGEWAWMQRCDGLNTFYRCVHSRTINALVRKGLIVRNGEMYILTVAGKSVKC